MSSTWQQIWTKAQPGLSEIKESLASSDSPSPRIIRVGKLDSELLDHELAQLLQEPLNKALSLVNSSLRTRFEPELSLLIRLTLYKLSIWNTGASYGAKLQNLRYTVPTSPGQTLSPSGLPRRILLVHGTLTTLIPYLHARIRSHALSRAWPDAPSSDRRRKAWGILTSLESSYTLVGLFSFVAFLWNGRYRTITDRILNMSLEPSLRHVKRNVSYEFMNRQMVWHAFTEFLLFLVPLINTRNIRRRLNRLTSVLTISSLYKFLPSSIQNTLRITPTAHTQTPLKEKRGKFWSLPRDQCAICAENASVNFNFSDSANAFTSLIAQPSTTFSSPQQTSPGAESDPSLYPIYTPYLTSCGDMYCYHCIAERLMQATDEGEDEMGWECLRCGEHVKSAERYVVEVDMSVGGSEISASDYEFSSDLDMDVTDMSASMGSYSESGLSDD